MADIEHNQFKKKNAIFWDVALCRYFVNWRFGGMYRLLQGIRNPRAMNQREEVAVDFLHPEDGGGTFLRNIG
jgi:hypothetical protein